MEATSSRRCPAFGALCGYRSAPRRPGVSRVFRPRYFRRVRSRTEPACARRLGLGMALLLAGCGTLVRFDDVWERRAIDAPAEDALLTA